MATGCRETLRPKPPQPMIPKHPFSHLRAYSVGACTHHRVLLEQTLDQGTRTIESSALVCPAQKIPQGLSTRRLRVRVLPGEPNLSATSFLRLLVDGGQVRTPQNGQYAGRPPLSGGKQHWALTPGAARRRLGFFCPPDRPAHGTRHPV